MAVDKEAVVVTSERRLHVVSSAPLGGGLATARSIVNLHVAKDFAHESLDGLVRALVRRRGLSAPVTALATAAWTERAEVASHVADGVTAIVAVTVGLSNVLAAGLSSITPARTPPSPSTINTIVIVDARPEPAALVNAIVTITEVKAAVLAAAGVRCASGEVATGTSTDAVVVAATGRGRACRFGGPLSDLGSLVARTARLALEAGVRGWLEANPP